MERLNDWPLSAGLTGSSRRVEWLVERLNDWPLPAGLTGSSRCPAPSDDVSSTIAVMFRMNVVMLMEGRRKGVREDFSGPPPSAGGCTAMTTCALSPPSAGVVDALRRRLLDTLGLSGGLGAESEAS